MSASDGPSETTSAPAPKSSRLDGRIVGGAIALSLLMIGAGIGIGAAIWSGSSSTPTVPAASNAAPGSPQPNSVEISLTSTWNGIPQGTHVSIDVNGPSQCIDQARSQAFDPSAGTSSRTDVVFTVVRSLHCDTNGYNSWMTVTAKTASVTEIRRINLYRPSNTPTYRVNCDGPQPGKNLGCVATAMAPAGGSVSLRWT